MASNHENKNQNNKQSEENVNEEVFVSASRDDAAQQKIEEAVPIGNPTSSTTDDESEGEIDMGVSLIKEVTFIVCTSLVKWWTVELSNGDFYYITAELWSTSEGPLLVIGRLPSAHTVEFFEAFTYDRVSVTARLPADLSRAQEVLDQDKLAGTNVAIRVTYRRGKWNSYEMLLNRHIWYLPPYEGLLVADYATRLTLTPTVSKLDKGDGPFQTVCKARLDYTKMQQLYLSFSTGRSGALTPTERHFPQKLKINDESLYVCAPGFRVCNPVGPFRPNLEYMYKASMKGYANADLPIREVCACHPKQVGFVSMAWKQFKDERKRESEKGKDPVPSSSSATTTTTATAPVQFVKGAVQDVGSSVASSSGSKPVAADGSAAPGDSQTQGAQKASKWWNETWNEDGTKAMDACCEVFTGFYATHLSDGIALSHKTIEPQLKGFSSFFYFGRRKVRDDRPKTYTYGELFEIWEKEAVKTSSYVDRMKTYFRDQVDRVKGFLGMAVTPEDLSLTDKARLKSMSMVMTSKSVASSAKNKLGAIQKTLAGVLVKSYADAKVALYQVLHPDWTDVASFAFVAVTYGLSMYATHKVFKSKLKSLSTMDRVCWLMKIVSIPLGLGNLLGDGTKWTKTLQNLLLTGGIVGSVASTLMKTPGVFESDSDFPQLDEAQNHMMQKLGKQLQDADFGGCLDDLITVIQHGDARYGILKDLVQEIGGASTALDISTTFASIYGEAFDDASETKEQRMKRKRDTAKYTKDVLVARTYLATCVIKYRRRYYCKNTAAVSRALAGLLADVKRADVQPLVSIILQLIHEVENPWERAKDDIKKNNIKGLIRTVTVHPMESLAVVGILGSVLTAIVTYVKKEYPGAFESGSAKQRRPYLISDPDEQVIQALQNNTLGKPITLNQKIDGKGVLPEGVWMITDKGGKKRVVHVFGTHESAAAPPATEQALIAEGTLFAKNPSFSKHDPDSPAKWARFKAVLRLLPEKEARKLRELAYANLKQKIELSVAGPESITPDMFAQNRIFSHESVIPAKFREKSHELKQQLIKTRDRVSSAVTEELRKVQGLESRFHLPEDPYSSFSYAPFPTGPESNGSEVIDTAVPTRVPQRTTPLQAPLRPSYPPPPPPPFSQPLPVRNYEASRTILKHAPEGEPLVDMPADGEFDPVFYTPYVEVNGERRPLKENAHESATQNPIFAVKPGCVVELLDKDYVRVQVGVVTTAGLLTTYHDSHRFRFVRTSTAIYDLGEFDREKCRVPRDGAEGDLSLLRVAVPVAAGQTLPTKDIRMERLNPGVPIILLTYAQGKHRFHTGNVLGKIEEDSQLGPLQKHSASTGGGDCGGGVFTIDGHLVGIHFYGFAHGENGFIPLSLYPSLRSYLNLASPRSIGEVSRASN